MWLPYIIAYIAQDSDAVIVLELGGQRQRRYLLKRYACNELSRFQVAAAIYTFQAAGRIGKTCVRVQ